MAMGIVILEEEWVCMVKPLSCTRSTSEVVLPMLLYITLALRLMANLPFCRLPLTPPPPPRVEAMAMTVP